jgi:glycosyltransferase involved in cell wall biosynthesis
VKNVLIISNNFPPVVGAGTVRVTKFAKFLPEFGWKPLVLTTPAHQSKRSTETNPSQYQVYRVTWPNFTPLFTLTRRLFPKHVKQPTSPHYSSFQGRSRQLTSWFLLPDELITWIPFAVLSGLSIARKCKIDAIVSSSPLQSNHLAALVLSKLLRCAWIADFRDPWATHPFFLYPTWLHRWLNAALERLVVNHASYVITVTHSWLQEFLSRYPEQGADKFQMIPNGFDPDDFPTDSDPTKQVSCVKIVHSGKLFYDGKNPFGFLQAVKLLVAQHKLSNLEVHFVGVPVDKLEPVIHSMDLDHIVKLSELLPHKKSLAYVQNADILLLISGPQKGLINAKAFEYMATCKPILALTPADSESARLLKQTNLAEIVDPDSPQAIAEKLELLINRRRNGFSFNPNREFIQQFNRRTQARRLADYLDEAGAAASPVRA